jgi:hypothetical protein
MSRRPIITGAVLAIATFAPSAAAADGLPVPVDNAGPSGLVSADGSARYVTLGAGHGTTVARIDRKTGVVVEHRYLPGYFTIPVVALDGTPAGLSQNGRTLVLIRPRTAFPRTRTTLAIMDARHVATRRVVTLRGDFSFDAVAPDGRTVFLVQYVSRIDPTQDRVRAFDSARGRLLAAPVVDPREPAGAMNGFPLTRVTSPDGRWHYTLYDGAGKAPFVHALDTRARRAKCIDLPGLAGGSDYSGFRLGMSGDGGVLTVLGDRRRPLLRVDTATFRVTRPAAASGAHAGSGGGSDATGTLAAAGLALVLGSAGLATAVRRRRRRTATAA